MEERQICCCGARTWTLVIGWLQIRPDSIGSLYTIGSVLGLLVMGFVSFLGMILYDLQHPITNLNAVLVAILIIAILSAAIALYILGIVMAIFLIRGCKDKNLRQINSWIIYAKITAVIYAGFSGAKLFFVMIYFLELDLARIIVLCLLIGIQIAVQILSIRIVGIYKTEIEASREPFVAYNALI